MATLPHARPPSVLRGVLLGAVTALPLIAVAYLGSVLAGLPFIPFDAADVKREDQHERQHRRRGRNQQQQHAGQGDQQQG